MLHRNSLSFRRLLDLEHEELEAKAKLEDEEHEMRFATFVFWPESV